MKEAARKAGKGACDGHACRNVRAGRHWRVPPEPLFVGIVLLVAGVAVAMIQYKVPTIMAPLMAQFSLDAQTASWLMSVFTLASIVMAIPSGMLAKRFGAKTMMVVACGIAVAGSSWACSQAWRPASSFPAPSKGPPSPS